MDEGITVEEYCATTSFSQITDPEVTWSGYHGMCYPVLYNTALTLLILAVGVAAFVFIRKFTKGNRALFWIVLTLAAIGWLMGTLLVFDIVHLDWSRF